MDESMNEFLVEGFRRYGDALGTLLTFEDAIQELLGKILLERESWGAFRAGESVKHWHIRPQRKLGAYRDGKLRGSKVAYVNIAVWWDDSVRDSGMPLLAACCEELGRFEPSDLPAGIRKRDDGKITWLVSDLDPKSTDMEPAFEALLSSLVQQFS